MATPRTNIGKQLAEAFGIPTEGLLSFDVHCRPNDIVTVTGVYAGEIDGGKLTEVLKVYELRERES